MRPVSCHVLAGVVVLLGLARGAQADIGAKCADAKTMFTAEGCVKRPPAPPASPEALYQQALDLLEKDGKRAYTLFDTACKRKHAKSCTQLGVLHETGRDRVVEKDAKKTSAYFELACNLGDGRGCQKRGSELRGTTDNEGARRWFDLGCQRGDGAACA